MINVERKELKYLVDPVNRLRLIKQLAPVLTEDAHNGAAGYSVRSLYFDSWDDVDFESKVDGYDDRKKIRLRIYDRNDAIIKLELKEKASDRQKKTSFPLTRAEAEQMMQGDYTGLLHRPEGALRNMALTMMTQCYRPKCLVEYDRFACVSDTNEIRVTFDANLRASEGNLNLFDAQAMLYPVAAPGEITMEVKYNHFLLSSVKNAINEIDKLNVSNSKYCRARMITKKGRY